MLSVKNECVPCNTLVAKECVELDNAIIAKYPVIMNSLETQAKEESEDEEDVDIMQQIEELQKQRDMLSRMSMGKKNTSEMKHRISMLLEQSKAITNKK